MSHNDKMEEIRTRVAAVANTASETDKREVAAIISKAKSSEYDTRMATVTPGMAALLFCYHNPHNRDWKGLWSEELLRRMQAGQWKQNGDSIRFSNTGNLADSQNRLAAFALSGEVVQVPIIFGLDPDAILTIDGGKQRYASDFAKLAGIDNAAEKERITKMASGYRVQSGDRTAALRSEVEVNREIVSNNRDLDTAIEIGRESGEAIVNPLLKPLEAATLVYLMIQGRWPIATVKERLRLFQRGFSQEGENDPFFQAGKLIEKSRTATDKRAKLSTTKQLGAAVFAMITVERGVKAVRAGAFRDAIKKSVPKADYPVDQANGSSPEVISEAELLHS